MTNRQKLAFLDLLWDSLRRDPEHHDRRQTGWGTKTQSCLIACIERIINADNLPPTDADLDRADAEKEARNG